MSAEVAERPGFGTPPAMANVVAERAVLGSLLLRPDLIGEVFDELTPGDFTAALHVDLAVLLSQLAETGKPIDVQVVFAEVLRRGWQERFRNGIVLAELRGVVDTIATLSTHVEAVAAAAARRRLWSAGVRAQQVAESLTADVPASAALLMTEAEDLVVGASRRRAPSPPPELEDFLRGPTTYDFLVPGLLERTDRLLITGVEGGGKSVLLRQMAVCCAAGMHPLKFTAMDPISVLLVDCENGTRHLRRAMRLLRDTASGYRRPVEPGRLRVLSRPEGLDLTQRDDTAWLLDRAVAANPDLLIIGPLYRLQSADTREEPAARAVVATLDLIRQRVGCALVLETHAPHAEPGRSVRNLRPIGSSLFLRWPEFGYGLRPAREAKVPGTVDVVPWRGPRDERDWPRQLRRGERGEMPWCDVESAPDGTWS